MKPITRIRYIANNEILESQQMFTKTEMVTAIINLDSLYWVIKNDADKQIIPRCSFKTEAQAKKAVKHKLKDLGVEFETEIRKSSTSLGKKLIAGLKEAVDSHESHDIFPYTEEHHEQDLLDLEMEETDEWLRDE